MPLDASGALPIAATAFQHVSNILAMRALPFAVYATIASGRSIPRRLLVMVVYMAGLFLLPVEFDRVFCPLLIGSVYYLSVASCVPLLTRALRMRLLTPGALFVLFAAAYLLLPAVVLPEIVGIFLILGWDLLLSSYSYCLDVSASRQSPALGDCLFFLLVNPALTYSSRGLRTGQPKLERRAVARILVGILTMFACSAALRPLFRDMANSTEPLASGSALVVFALAGGALRFLIEYAVHSGLASIQIGLMRLIGHTVPERYNYPLLATSPLDFWRRWNTYVNGWLSKYVFLPASRRLQHRFGRFTIAAALFLTFAASGLLHDGYGYSAHFKASTHHLQLFAITALAVLAWNAVERLRTAALSRHAFVRVLSTWAPRLGTWLLLILAAIRWG